MHEVAFSPLEIASVINDLGLPEKAFGDENSERMKIINCWDNCDIVACPGSGKTTVLLAKLLLLAHRMPFDDGRGVCVLTHTNVAINQIKHQLGTKSDVLFRHPNFFGTIQSFVDRFLSIPCFKEKYKCDVKSIDSKLYEQKIKVVHYWKFKNNKYCQDFYNNKGTINHYLIANENILNNLHYCITQNNKSRYLSRKINGKEIQINKPRSRTGYNNITKGIIYRYLDSVKETMHKYLHILSFDDAFYYADLYLRNHPIIGDILSKRYKYVFVDEMQDTQLHQLDIINKVFHQSIIRQLYGDIDQAIFDGISGGKTAWKPGSQYKKLQITDTKRFGELIATVVTPFCREIGRIYTNENQQSIKPYIILFEDPKDVLPTFYTIIKEHRLENEPWDKPNKPFNAVGFVGKESEGKLTLKSYFPDFNRTAQNKKVHFETLISYFQKQPEDLKKKLGSKVYYDSFMNGLLQLIEIGNSKHPKTNRYFTVSTFKAYLKEEDEMVFYKLQRLFAKLILELITEQKGSEEIKNTLLSFFKDNIDKKVISDFQSRAYNYPFVTSNDIDESDVISSKENIYKYSDDDIEIQVATVHSVKGKTHLATLFLETKNDNKCESDYFFDSCGNLFCGHEYKRPRSYIRLERRLKTTYVALSRPTKLLCVALQKDKVKCTECGNRNDQCNWEVSDTSYT